MKRVFLLLIPVAFLLSSLLHAQRTEVAATFGATLSPDAQGLVSCGEAIVCPIPLGTTGPLSFGWGFSWQASFAQRLKNFKAASLYLEVPVNGAPERTTPTFLVGGSYSSIFFTPGLQAKFLPRSRISPFASVGGGLAHYYGTVSNSSSNTGALGVGGGLDFKTPWPKLAFRAEVRDYITGRPAGAPFGAVTSNHVQNIFSGVGFVIKF